MKLSEAKLLDIIPEYMRDDKTIKGFSNAWDYIQKQIMYYIKFINLFDNLDQLTSEQLDQVAEAMQIPWYDTSLTDERKIDIIVHYEKNCFELGTLAAVSRVATDVFSDAVVFEWYEYGGQPFHFKISVNEQESEDLMDRVGRVVRAAKTAKATLDGVESSGKAVTTFYYTAHLHKSVTSVSIPAEQQNFDRKDSVHVPLGYRAVLAAIYNEVKIPASQQII